MTQTFKPVRSFIVFNSQAVAMGGGRQVLVLGHHKTPLGING